MPLGRLSGEVMTAMAERHIKRVYCSGPLFCPEEVAGMTAIAETLEKAGYATFLPHRDGLEAYLLQYVNDPRVNFIRIPPANRFLSRAAFALDIYQILERCDALVMNMNGRVPDEGAVAETAVAFAAGKPLVIYKNDHRTLLNGHDNSMLIGLSQTFSTVERMEKIPVEVGRILERVERTGPTPYRGESIPPNVREVLGLGGRVWNLLNTLNFFSPPEETERIAHLKELVKLCETLSEEGPV
jgi:nucleoside 2-deoxyribosyltransferase